MSEDKKAKRAELKDNPIEHGSVYFHISNSGVTFQVIDEGWGPTIVVSGSSFGNMSSQLKLHVDNKGLIALAKLFISASADEYSEEYVCKADGRLKLPNQEEEVRYYQTDSSESKDGD